MAVSRKGSNQFSKRLAIRRDEFIASSKQIMQTATLAALEVMVENTRIDTSKAVSNWIVTLQAPFQGDIEAYVPGNFGSTGSASIASALAFGRAVIEEYDPDTDQALFITNNVRYLRYIDGSVLTQLGQQAARASLAGARLFK